MQEKKSPYGWVTEPEKYEKDAKRVIIFDTSLRDGEQSPGAALGIDEKFQLSKYLADLGVDAIEAGFPISSPGDFNAVKKIADFNKNTDVAIFGLSRALDTDILRAYDAVKNAGIPGIHTFIGTSEQHIEKKFPGKTKEDIINIVRKEVSYARNLFDASGKKGLVEFSPEDAGRTNKDFLYRVCNAAIESGANIINIPDTVGYTLSWEFGTLISDLFKNVKNMDKIILSVHCHNDLGMATANSIEAIKNGALQVECTINGIGERAGNAALEEIVMALNVRNDLLNKKTSINAEKIFSTSKMFSASTGYHPQRNKAIVGTNAFAHEAGIHQDGVLKGETTYEIMTPESIGLTFNRLPLGRRSGKRALFERLSLLEYQIPENEKENIYSHFINIADYERKVTDSVLMKLMTDMEYKTSFVLPLRYINLDYTTTGEAPQAKLTLNYNGKLKFAFGKGDGPVDAAFDAMKQILGHNGEKNVDILTYNSSSLGIGSKATAKAEITIKINDDLITGEGYNTDIVKAAVISFIDAINEYKIRTK